MSSKDETNTPDIIEEIIPGKNDDYNNKSVNLNNNNNQQPFIENYNEKESAQAVIEATEESKKSIERKKVEAGNQMSHYGQAISYAQEQTAQVTKELAENYMKFQKQALNSYPSMYMSYFQNVQNQLWNSQESFNRISEMYYKLVSNYTESAMFFGRIFNEFVSLNMGILRNVISSPSINPSRMSNFEVDSGRNSDENSTNVKATFSCETCGQTFDSRQGLKEHTTINHYK
jgi:nitrogen fixation/metabolism regulation signal transduction histidine kinase